MSTTSFDVVVAGERIQGATAEVREPWSGRTLAAVVQANEEHANRAADAAVRAFGAMRKTPAHVRRDLLRGIARRIEADRDAAAELLAREAGKPLTQARAEVMRAVSTFDLASEEVSRPIGEVMPLDVTRAAEGYQGQWHRVPAGPVIAITPFNFPLNLVAHKVAPALACGTSVVLKPPPQTPLSSLRLASIVREVAASLGLPQEVLQVIPCAIPVAEQLVRDDRFRIFSFTGSDRAGWHLKSIAGKKRTLLELGGNAAVLVHEDAPLEHAANRITAGAFSYAGQVCIKVQRAIIHSTIAERFTSMLFERARALEPADPLDEKTVLGSMIDENNAKRVESWLEEARAGGADILVSSSRAGNRIGPAVVRVRADSTAKFRVVDEEVFGPVLVIQTYDTWEQALALANNTRFGLQCGVFTDSLERVRAAVDALAVGGIIVGDIPTFRVDNMPYGGVGDSGLGREGVRFAMAEMTEPKLVVFAPPTRA